MVRQEAPVCRHSAAQKDLAAVKEAVKEVSPVELSVAEITASLAAPPPPVPSPVEAAKALAAPPGPAPAPAPAPPPPAAQSSSRRQRNPSTPKTGANGASGTSVAGIGITGVQPIKGTLGSAQPEASNSATLGSTLVAGSAGVAPPAAVSSLLAPAACTAPAVAIAVAPLTAASAAATPAVPQVGLQALQESAHSGEVFLIEMLAAMDSHMQQLRETQQGLVATVELACRRALGRNFGRLALVGSAALRVETPGSDVDVVCFTRRDGPEAPEMPVDVLRRVHWALSVLVRQYADNGANFSMEFIDIARVPILRVLWGSSACPIAVDVSVDQVRPVDHVRWFQRVGAAPRPTAPPPAVAPLVTLTLRCVKWWLRQRQIPRTKEGGLPTLAWLLMAVHVCSLPETHEQAIISGQRPMVALLASLAAFFHHYAAADGLDGTLVFAADGSSSEFRRRSETRSGSNMPVARTSAWAELSVLDPTREGMESLDLVPRLPPATQLLLAHELRRASQRLQRVPKGRETAFGDGRCVLEEVFEALPEGTNTLPCYVGPGGMSALMLLEDGSKGLGTVELGIIDRIVPRPGWNAPFLLRADERSEVHARLFSIEDSSGKCSPRRSYSPLVVLCPCHFICRVNVERDGRCFRLDAEGMNRYNTMKSYISDLRDRHQKAAELTGKAQPEAKEVEAEVTSIARTPTPSRSSVARP
mmetsp:Transcript_29371/g.51462  ORF Transcript_29371/g.51462 Transcript_29371/m.51462 type:complete len:702 (+) Transcript_29371:211-2316(+)